MSIVKHLFHFSDYLEDHFLHSKTNYQVPLMETDERNGKILKEVVCLRTKLCRLDNRGTLKICST